MSDQPIFAEGSGSSKMCWSCAATTPYNQGFCDDCWIAMPVEVKFIYTQVAFLPPPFGGLLRMAVADGLRAALRPRPQVGNWSDRHGSRKRLTGLSINDLDF